MNTLVLTLKWPNINPKTETSLNIVNYVCTGIFVVEAILKLIAFGRDYFRDGWNIFDFIIAIVSIISVSISQNRSKFLLIRAFRIGRVFKYFTRLKKLSGIFMTFLTTLPALTNITMLILLIMYIYAIIGVQYLAQVKLNEPMTRLLNF